MHFVVSQVRPVYFCCFMILRGPCIGLFRKLFNFTFVAVLIQSLQSDMDLFLINFMLLHKRSRDSVVGIATSYGLDD
jgi:hypothetical protein